MRPSVANYSYMLNSNVWAGADRNIVGPYFSNGGIRMDGTNNSDVISAVSTWSCTSSYGCSPSNSNAPGITGSGSGSALWSYPGASVDFNGISVSLANLKSYAQNSGGRYFAPASGSQTQRGYHVIFKSDGTFDLYRVTSTTAIPGYSDTNGWQTEYSIIASQVFVGNYTIPSSCSVLYFEDRVWVEGVVTTKVTMAVADLINANSVPNAYLLNNISYSKQDGSVGFALMAEGSVLLALNSPNIMSIHGIFVAQTGSYGRNFYATSSADYGAFALPSALASYAQRSQLTTYGTVVSNGRTGTAWQCAGWSVNCSGFLSRIDAYDELQALAPPPFTPSASPDYKYVIWREN